MNSNNTSHEAWLDEPWELTPEQIASITGKPLPPTKPVKPKATVQIPCYMRVIQGGKSARATEPQPVPAPTRPKQLEFPF